MTRIGEVRLARLLTGWTAGRGPLRARLADALARLIDLGELPPGAALPAERTLAEALSVSRTTVVAAYGSLRASGHLRSRQGSGTFVRVGGPPGGTAGGAGFPEGRLTTFLSPPESRAGASGSVPVIDLTSGALPGLPLFAEVAASLTAADLLERLEGSGYAPAGLPELRAAVAARYTEAGVPTEPGQIIVTSGSQQALRLIAAAWLEPGDAVVTEDPAYRGALEVFRTAGAALYPVPVDDGGVDPEALARAVAVHRPRFVYLQPTAQNPTGSVLGAARRAAIAAIPGTLLIEDESAADTLLGDGPPPPPLAAHRPDGPERVVSIGSLSKLFWGGLRIGWLRVPLADAPRLAWIKSGFDLGCPVPAQLIALRLLPLRERALAERRAQLTAGLGLLTGLLRERLPGWRWPEPAGGGALWITLPPFAGNAVTFAAAASAHGVDVSPGPVFAVAGGSRDRLRVPFTAPPQVLSTAVERLARTWDEQARR